MTWLPLRLGNECLSILGASWVRVSNPIRDKIFVPFWFTDAITGVRVNLAVEFANWSGGDDEVGVMVNSDMPFVSGSLIRNGGFEDK